MSIAPSSSSGKRAREQTFSLQMEKFAPDFREGKFLVAVLRRYGFVASLRAVRADGTPGDAVRGNTRLVCTAQIENEDGEVVEDMCEGNTAVADSSGEFRFPNFYVRKGNRGSPGLRLVFWVEHNGMRYEQATEVLVWSKRVKVDRVLELADHVPLCMAIKLSVGSNMSKAVEQLLEEEGVPMNLRKKKSKGVVVEKKMAVVVDDKESKSIVECLEAFMKKDSGLANFELSASDKNFLDECEEDLEVGNPERLEMAKRVFAASFHSTMSAVNDLLIGDFLQLIDQDTAEKQLSGRPVGTFNLRLSTRMPVGEIVVSFVAPDKKVVHRYLIDDTERPIELSMRMATKFIMESNELQNFSPSGKHKNDIFDSYTTFMAPLSPRTSPRTSMVRTPPLSKTPPTVPLHVDVWDSPPRSVSPPRSSAAPDKNPFLTDIDFDMLCDSDRDTGSFNASRHVFGMAS